MKTREEIIHGMCMTYRHDYGLLKDDADDSLFCGMTRKQQLALYDSMSQIFYHNIEELYVAAEKYKTIKGLI